MKHIWIDSDAALAAALDAHRGAANVAIDTEFRRRDTFFPQVALLQICWNDVAYLVDPICISDTSGIECLLQDSAVTKYLHSASEDLEVFEHWLGIKPTPLFDTQRAAGLVGLDPGISYRALVAEFKGIEVPKDETQSDWLKRPLTDAQQEYAALDVVYLLDIGRELEARVMELGRLDWVLEDGARMATGGKGPLAKFKSAWKLDLRQRSALAALVEWRDERARDRDKPRSWIAPDKALTAIAQRLPESVNSLAALDGVPEPLARRQGRRLLDVVARAADGTYVTDWCPQKPLPRDAKAQLNVLAARRDEIAAALAVAPEVLVANRDLELLLREALGETIEEPPAWQGWRAEQVVQPLRETAASLVTGKVAGTVTGKQ